jgi:hypothetical protein
VLLKGWLDKRRQASSNSATDTAAAAPDVKNNSCLVEAARATAGVAAQVTHHAGTALACDANGLLLQNKHSQQAFQQQQQQQVALILQRGRSQQQQHERQALVVPKACVADVSDSIAALVLQLRSTVLVPW